MVKLYIEYKPKSERSSKKKLRHMSGHKLYTTPNYFKLNAQSIKLFQVENYYAKYIVGF